MEDSNLDLSNSPDEVNDSHSQDENDSEVINESDSIDDAVIDSNTSEDQKSDEAEEVIEIIGEEQEEKEPAPAWVKELRKNYKDSQRKIRELEGQLNKTKVEEAPKLAPKPTLESCEYDEDKYEASLDVWYERKLKFDEHQAKEELKKLEQQQAWQNDLNNYNECKSKIKVSDYADAESNLVSIFSVEQQQVLVKSTKNPAYVVYALGKNDKFAKEMASIKDVVKLAVAFRDFENEKMRVNQKKISPAPDRRVNSTTSGGADHKLLQLEEEADRTGDRSRLHKYKLELKKKGT